MENEIKSTTPHLIIIPEVNQHFQQISNQIDKKRLNKREAIQEAETITYDRHGRNTVLNSPVYC